MSDEIFFVTGAHDVRSGAVAEVLEAGRKVVGGHFGRVG